MSDINISAAAGGGGDGSGDLYGDLWVLLRDLDPSDGGGNGEPILDENGQVIPIGYNAETGEIFPIHLVLGAEGDYEVPADLLPYVQEINLERANIIRSPDSVMAGRTGRSARQDREWHDDYHVGGWPDRG